MGRYLLKPPLPEPPNPLTRRCFWNLQPLSEEMSNGQDSVISSSLSPFSSSISSSSSHRILGSSGCYQTCGLASTSQVLGFQASTTMCNFSAFYSWASVYVYCVMRVPIPVIVRLTEFDYRLGKCHNLSLLVT